MPSADVVDLIYDVAIVIGMGFIATATFVLWVIWLSRQIDSWEESDDKVSKENPSGD